ncbi:MAG: formylglycine-generating enzyme family protein [Spirochaetes bacterium]|nr:formylglycine-generating enzyme family protein [Spirochaetota bacterium]
MKRNKLRLTLAAAIAGLVFSIAACTSSTPGVAQAGDTIAPQAAAWNAGDVIVSPAGIATAWIPAGTFTMGSPVDEIGRWDNEAPQRQVTISEGFWMGVFPVTQQQWLAVMGSNPSHFHANPAAGETQGRRPVENVSWHDAILFANRLSLLEGLNPAYSINDSANPNDWGVEIIAGSNGWRLPTEAQWEFAARAGTATAFSNGTSDWQNEAELDFIGWFDFNSGGITREVGLKQPNPWGLYDIHGNVWEWVWDWFEDYPADASSGAFRALRGGCSFFLARNARSAGRNGVNPFHRGSNMGLRLVRP